jgi:hypothetical protein
MIKTMQGTVHGRTIEFAEDIGMREGQDVTVTVRPLPPAHQWGEGIRRSAGAMAGDVIFESVMEEIQRERKRERRPLA